MKVLGIESSCDETALAIVENGKKILISEIASQSDLHALYGGVVPELASRRHSQLLFPILAQVLEKTKLQLQHIDLIAATHTPGLHGALMVGVQAAKGLAIGLQKPFIGVHHIEAHLYSAWMSQEHMDPQKDLPALGLVISGGHTQLWLIEKLGSYTLLSHTLDDALGEAFDKVAIMLGLPYPGGPHIERLAALGDPTRYPLKAGTSKKDPLKFSYSGLKTQVLHTLWGHDLSRLNTLKSQTPDHLTLEDKANLAASFQHAVFHDLCAKLSHFEKEYRPKSIWIGGGVASSSALRQMMSEKLKSPLFWPLKSLSVDNGAMIAGLGFHQYLTSGPSPLDLPVLPRQLLISWARS
jgi:N6-L-threonylcarbamoyladenine synthase